jgi:hypothetical protein
MFCSQGATHAPSCHTLCQDTKPASLVHWTSERSDVQWSSEAGYVFQHTLLDVLIPFLLEQY